MSEQNDILKPVRPCKQCGGWHVYDESMGIDVAGLCMGCIRCSSLDKNTHTYSEVMALQRDLLEIEMHCPCGARPESPNTHPHVGGCPVERALRNIEAIVWHSLLPTSDNDWLHRLTKPRQWDRPIRDEDLLKTISAKAQPVSQGNSVSSK